MERVPTKYRAKVVGATSTATTDYTVLTVDCSWIFMKYPAYIISTWRASVLFCRGVMWSRNSTDSPCRPSTTGVLGWVRLDWVGFIWTAEIGHYCWTAARKSAIIVLKVTSCCGTDSERPHRCCSLPNNFGSRRIFPILLNAIGREMSPKNCLFPWGRTQYAYVVLCKIKGQFAAFCQKLFTTCYFFRFY